MRPFPVEMFGHLHVFQEVIGGGKQGQGTNGKGCYTKVWVASSARDDLVNDLFDSGAYNLILLWTNGGGAGNERD